jgi:hypothetical protein
MLVLAGVSVSNAFVATLAYRLGSYWLPLMAGPIAYGLFRRRYGPFRQPRQHPGQRGNTDADAVKRPARPNRLHFERPPATTPPLVLLQKLQVQHTHRCRRTAPRG